MRSIAIFASGSGTNTENIIKYFSTKNNVKVSIVLSNRSDAVVLERAARLGVPSIFFDREEFYNTDKVLRYLVLSKADFIVLAGFLWLVPDNILSKYSPRFATILWR
jgi:phosphoribosylglycinamide formyltransferase-1